MCSQHPLGFVHLMKLLPYGRMLENPQFLKQLYSLVKVFSAYFRDFKTKRKASAGIVFVNHLDPRLVSYTRSGHALPTPSQIGRHPGRRLAGSSEDYF